MPLRVWQLDPAQLTAYYNMAVCDALAEAGCTVRYLTSQYLYDTLPQSPLVERETIYFRGLNRPFLLKYPRLRRILRGISYPFGHLRVLREARRQRPDIVHMQWSRVPRFDLWLIRQLKALGIPVVHTIHDVVPLFAASGDTQPLKQVYTEVDALIVHTEANKSDFLRHYPEIPAERLHLVPLVEFSGAELPAHTSQAQAREHLGLPMDAPIVGYFGSIKHYKGLDILLSAFEIARQQRPDLHLLIGGKIDPLEASKIPTAETIRAMKNVHLVEGYIPTDDTWMYHLAPDVFVLPYRHIYQSAALITAMGFGCPVIATRVGGMPETIDGNGWIVPPEDPQALAQSILDAVSNPEQLTTMGQRSKEIIAERHSKSTVAKFLIETYTQVLSESRR